jgi:hypothetical protein
MTLHVAHLRKCADDLHAAYDVLKISCTRDAARDFIAQFNRTVLAIEQVHDRVPPAPNGGRVPVEKSAGATDQASARGSV